MNAKIIVVLAAFLLMGCVDRHHPDVYTDPSVRVKSIVTADAQFGIPAKFIIELENIGYDTAYEVEGSVDLEIGTQVIESVYFSVPTIREGRTAVVELELSTVYYHDEYDSYVLEFSWLDYYGNYYY